MKKTRRFLTAMLALTMSVSTICSFASCGNQDENAIGELNSVTSELQSSIDENKSELDSQIAALTADYTAKFNTLSQQIAQIQQSIITLKSDYDAKLEALKSADEDNAQAIEDLTESYNAKVSTFETAIERLNSIIESNKTQLDNKIAELTLAFEEDLTELLGKVTNLENTRITNVEFLSNGNLLITFGDGSQQVVTAPQQHVHTYGDWYGLGGTSSDGNELCYRICSTCKEVQWKDFAAHEESSGETSDWSDAEVSSETQGSESSSAEQGGSSNPGSEDMGGYIPKKPYELNVYSFTGGYGEAWLDALEKRYMEERAGDVIYVDGIQYDGITFNNAKDKNTMASMVATGAQYDVCFQEQVLFNQFVQQDVFKDMTDVMNSENPYEPGKTLESKLNQQQKDYYMRDNKYYGIPHYAGYVGIVYNKRMFDDTMAYLAKDYDKEMLKVDPINCFVWDLEEPRTPGPDGVEGTDDDGLPITYDEFYALCEFFSTTNKAIAWSGKYRDSYLSWFLTAMTANNEGAEQAALNYSFDGTATNLVSVIEDNNGNPVFTELGEVELEAKNSGYLLAQQKGKYYALDFLETIVDNEWHTANSFSPIYEHLEVQRDFVEGAINPLERPAMLIDGCWWQMEAQDSFTRLKEGGVDNPEDKFGWMPLPCVDEAAAAARAAKLSAGEAGYTLADTHNSLCFIGAQVSDDVYVIAKDFVQFAYTDESLAEFSIITNTPKAVSYTMTADQKAQMSAYGRALMDMQSKADIVYSFANTDFFKRNESLLVDFQNTYSSMFNGRKCLIPVDEFRKGVSAATYFNGMLEMQTYNWELYII